MYRMFSQMGKSIVKNISLREIMGKSATTYGNKFHTQLIYLLMVKFIHS